jgi:hypothetical protein
MQVSWHVPFRLIPGRAGWMWPFGPHIGPTRQGWLGQRLAGWSLDGDGFVRVHIRSQPNRAGRLAEELSETLPPAQVDWYDCWS